MASADLTDAILTGARLSDAILTGADLTSANLTGTRLTLATLTEHDDYQDSILPSGQFAGTPEEALDCACGLYLDDPSPRSAAPIDLMTRSWVNRQDEAVVASDVP